MFNNSQFNQDIDAWTINPKCKINYMFDKSKMMRLPTWYKKR